MLNTHKHELVQYNNMYMNMNFYIIHYTVYIQVLEHELNNRKIMYNIFVSIRIFHLFCGENLS